MLSFFKKIAYFLGIIEKPEIIRRDVLKVEVQPELFLLVYWKILKIGKGPALILYADQKEVAKFDCFGEGKGHFHLPNNYDKRIYFEEETARDQIEKTFEILSQDSRSLLKQHHSRKIKNIIISSESYLIALNRAKDQMIYYLENVPALKD